MWTGAINTSVSSLPPLTHSHDDTVRLLSVARGLGRNNVDFALSRWDGGRREESPPKQGVYLTWIHVKTQHHTSAEQAHGFTFILIMEAAFWCHSGSPMIHSCPGAESALTWIIKTLTHLQVVGSLVIARFLVHLSLHQSWHFKTCYYILTCLSSNLYGWLQIECIDIYFY